MLRPAHCACLCARLPQSLADYVKYALPTATSMTLLAWSLVEFSGGYAAAGVLNSATSQLRWGADYLMRAHVTPSSFVVQVSEKGATCHAAALPQRLRMVVSSQLATLQPGCRPTVLALPDKSAPCRAAVQAVMSVPGRAPLAWLSCLLLLPL